MKFKVPPGGSVKKYPAGTAMFHTTYWVFDKEGTLVGIYEDDGSTEYDTEKED